VEAEEGKVAGDDGVPVGLEIVVGVGVGVVGDV